MNQNKYDSAKAETNVNDFMTFSSSPVSIVTSLSFLLNYLNSLFLLDFVAKNKLVQRLLDHKNPCEFRVSTS